MFRVRIPWVEQGHLVIDGREYDIVDSHAEIAPEHWPALADTSAEPAPLDAVTASPVPVAAQPTDADARPVLGPDAGHVDVRPAPAVGAAPDAPKRAPRPAARKSAAVRARRSR